MSKEGGPERAQLERFESTPNREPRFAMAMAAMLGPRTFYLPFCGVTKYRQIAEEIGCYLDFWPINPGPSFQVARKGLKPDDKSIIVSASGSYRGETSLTQAWAHKNKALAIPSYFFFPHRDDFNTVGLVTEQLRRYDGRQIPVVQYPESPREKRDEILTPRLVQPVPEEFIKQSIRTPDDLDKYLLTNSFDGFCFDTQHSRFLFTDPRFRHLFEEVIKRSSLVHVSLGRSDAQRPDYPIDAQKELRDVTFPDNRFTQIARLLLEIRDSGFDGTYVLEIPVESIVATLYPNKPKLLKPFGVSCAYLLVKTGLQKLLRN